MTRWHGYALLERPDGVTDEAWSRLLSHLDEAPADPQPARRLHYARNGSQYLTEANFDPTKLDAEHLTGELGASMRHRVRPFRKHDDRLRSRDLALDYMADGWDRDLMSRTFYPEDYGAGPAESAATNTSAIQGAIDDAKRSGGTVKLTQEYTVEKQGTADFGMYSDTDYCLIVDSDNVRIEGPGTIKLTSMPTITTDLLAVIAFGTTTGWTEYPQSDEDGNWISNAGISGVTFDLSAISEADRLLGSGGAPSGCVMFSYARRFYCRGCTFVDGVGIGVIDAHFSCKYGDISDNIILGAPKNGIRLDGCRATTVTNNRIIGNALGHTGAVSVYGVSILANKDNRTNSQWITIADNLFLNCRNGGVVATCEDALITDNDFYWLSNNNGAKALILNHSSNAQTGSYSSDHTTIRDNRFYLVDTIASGTCIDIFGTDEGAEGTAIAQDGIRVIGNDIHSNWGTSVALGEQVTNSYVTNNILPNSVTENASASGNTITPNY